MIKLLFFRTHRNSLCIFSKITYQRCDIPIIIRTLHLIDIQDIFPVIDI